MQLQINISFPWSMKGNRLTRIGLQEHLRLSEDLLGPVLVFLCDRFLFIDKFINVASFSRWDIHLGSTSNGQFLNGKVVYSVLWCMHLRWGLYGDSFAQNCDCHSSLWSADYRLNIYFFRYFCSWINCQLSLSG